MSQFIVFAVKLPLLNLLAIESAIFSHPYPVIFVTASAKDNRIPEGMLIIGGVPMTMQFSHKGDKSR